MAQDGLTVSNEAGVMTITLDRPEKLNAYTDAMGRALARSVRAASEDDAIRAIIITGAVCLPGPLPRPTLQEHQAPLPRPALQEQLLV